MSAPQPLSFCAEQVRRLDPDRFLCVLFAPPDRREDLFTLYAFNSEVARSRESVRDPLLGRIRLQWWRDALNQAFSGASAGKESAASSIVVPIQAPIDTHQIFKPLAEVIRRHGLTQEPFDRLLDARELDMEEEPPADLDALLRYAEATSADLSLLALGILGIQEGEAVAAAREVGIGWAITGLLRALPFHARARRIYLPARLMAEKGIDPGAVVERHFTPALAEAVAALAGEAHCALAAARRRRVPPAALRAALPVLLPAILADQALSRLAQRGYNPFAEGLERDRPLRQIRLLFAALRGKF